MVSWVFLRVWRSNKRRRRNHRNAGSRALQIKLRGPAQTRRLLSLENQHIRPQTLRRDRRVRFYPANGTRRKVFQWKHGIHHGRHPARGRGCLWAGQLHADGYSALGWGVNRVQGAHTRRLHGNATLQRFDNVSIKIQYSMKMIVWQKPSPAHVWRCLDKRSFCILTVRKVLDPKQEDKKPREETYVRPIGAYVGLYMMN